MRIENGKIVQATESELFNYWLKQYSDLYSYTDYKSRMVRLGVVITDDNKRDLYKCRTDGHTE